jgi:hypothetical protein
MIADSTAILLKAISKVFTTNDQKFVLEKKAFNTFILNSFHKFN